MRPERDPAVYLPVYYTPMIYKTRSPENLSAGYDIQLTIMEHWNMAYFAELKLACRIEPGMRLPDKTAILNKWRIRDDN